MPCVYANADTHTHTEQYYTTAVLKEETLEVLHTVQPTYWTICLYILDNLLKVLNTLSITQNTDCTDV